MIHRISLSAWLGLSLLAVGCAAAGGSLSSGSPESGPAQPKVNRAIIAVEPPTRETNEIRHASTPNGWHLTPMHESLLGIDPDTGTKIARLATSWKVEPDGKSVRFHLRKGVRFHPSTSSGRAEDWGEFTASDLLHQADEARRDDSLAGVTPFWRGVLDRIEIVNDNEAVYHLKRPDGNFLDYVSDQLGGMEVTSKKHFEKNGPATMHGGPVVGTGPYQFLEREEGSFIRFQRVPYQHWRVTPDFPEVEFRFIKEASTRLAAFMAGEVQLAGLPEDLLQQAQRAGHKVVAGRVPALRTFVNFDCCAYADPKDYSKGRVDSTSPLLDVRVRKALSKAVNRDELNKGFFNGKGTLLANNPMHPLRIGWNPEWERRFQTEYGYDPVAARALLGEAGYGPSNPLKVNFELVIVSGLSATSDIAEAISNYWRNIGVQIELQNLEGAQQTALRRAGRLNNHMFVMATNSNQWVGIYNMGTTRARLPGFVGNTGPEMEEVDKWLDEISNTLDEQKIENAWRQMGDVLFTQHKFIPLFWLPVEVVVDPKIVSDWALPGSISGSWTHTENIKAAR